MALGLGPRAYMKSDREITLRIIVDGPPAGVTFRLQRGRTDLVEPVKVSKSEIAFDLIVRVGSRPDGQPNFLGPFAHGAPASRFVYVNSGTLAGQSDSCWSRRAKVPLHEITWDLIDAGALMARIPGTRGGGPVCGTVSLIEGWAPIPQAQSTKHDR